MAYSLLVGAIVIPRMGVLMKSDIPRMRVMFEGCFKEVNANVQRLSDEM
jgi:hypothetical protein